MLVFHQGIQLELIFSTFHYYFKIVSAGHQILLLFSLAFNNLLKNKKGI